MYQTPEQIADTVDERELPMVDKDTIDMNAIEDAIFRASSLIDVHLRTAGINLPADQDTADLVTPICIDLTRYFMADKITAELEKRHTDAIDFLKQVSSGKLRVGPQPDGSNSEAGKQKRTGMFNVKVTRV